MNCMQTLYEKGFLGDKLQVSVTRHGEPEELFVVDYAHHDTGNRTPKEPNHLKE